MIYLHKLIIFRSKIGFQMRIEILACFCQFLIFKLKGRGHRQSRAKDIQLSSDSSLDLLVIRGIWYNKVTLFFDFTHCNAISHSICNYFSRKVILEKWFCKLGFFFWSTTFLQPEKKVVYSISPPFFLVNHFSRTRKKIRVCRTTFLQPEKKIWVCRTTFLEPLF